MSSEATVAAVMAAGLLAYGYVQYTTKQTPPEPTAQPSVKGGKKKKQADSIPPAKPVVVQFPTVIPGGFATDTVDTEPESKPAKKSKKKKGKKAAPDNQSEGSSAAA